MGHAKNKMFTVHRLVALHFVPGRTNERDVVNHKDGNKNNNHVSNLEWVTYSENNKHAFAIGRRDREKNRIQLRQAQQKRWAGHIKKDKQIAA